MGSQNRSLRRFFLNEQENVFLGWFLFFLILPTFLHASENAGHAEINWWHLGSAYKDAPALGWLTITFAIFVYGLVRMLKKPLSLYLETRSKDIRRQIDEGKRLKEESEAKLAHYEERLKSLDAEIERLKAAFHEQAAAEKVERERVAKEMEVRILQDAEDTIKASYTRSRNRLASEVINRALFLAEETIARSKREQVDEALKNSFIDDLKAAAKEVH